MRELKVFSNNTVVYLKLDKLGIKKKHRQDLSHLSKLVLMHSNMLTT